MVGRFDISEKVFNCIWFSLYINIFTYTIMSPNIFILDFYLPYFNVSNSALLWPTTRVPSFYIDVVSTLSITNQFIRAPLNANVFSEIKCYDLHFRECMTSGCCYYATKQGPCYWRFFFKQKFKFDGEFDLLVPQFWYRNHYRIIHMPRQLLSWNGPLVCLVLWASYQIKLRVAHAPGMPGTFSPPSTSRETAG